MKLTLNPASTFAAPAQISVPGQADPVTVTITWRHKGRKALADWVVQLTKTDDVDVLSDVIAGWGDEIDAPYTRENLAALLDAYPTAALDFARAYVAAMSGERAKN